MNSANAGLSLLECIVTISILCILGLVAAPFANWVDKSRLESSARQLNSEIQYARTLAAKRQRVVTVCGSSDGISCNKEWADGELMIFVDENSNRALDASEPLFRKLTLPSMHISWRGSNRNYMRARPNGSLIEWGRYTLCPNSASQSAIQLLYNRMGRAYTVKPSADDLASDGLCQN